MFHVITPPFDRGRRGQVVMDRFKSPVIETEADHLKVMFYNDLNPKRANMVFHPKEFKYSSFHHYTYGKDDSLVDWAPVNEKMGKTIEVWWRKFLKMIGK